MSQPSVAHVLRKYDPEQWGGTETHIAEITRRLMERSVRCEVHAPKGPGAPDTMLAAGVPLRRYQAFCPFLGSKEKRLGLVQNAGNIASFDLFWRLRADRSVDVAHVHTTRRIGGAVRSAMRWTGRPYVVSLHGPVLSDQTWLQQDTKKRLRGLIDAGQCVGALVGSRRVLDDAARVISFNDDEHAALEKRLGRRAVRMNHGVCVERFASGCRLRASRRWPQLEDRRVVLVLGRLCAQKNQRLAIDAFAKAAGPQDLLVLAGSATDPGYAAALGDAAQAAGVGERVVLLGNVAPVDIPDLLARATVVLAPSTQEAFGLVVLEAWAADRAILFSRVGGLNVIASHLADGGAEVALAEGDVLAFRAELRRCLTDPARLRAHAEAGRDVVSKHFSWEAVTEELCALYREVVSEHSRRGPHA